MDKSTFRKHVEGAMEQMAQFGSCTYGEPEIIPPISWAKSLEAQLTPLSHHNITSDWSTTFFECCGYIARMHMHKLTREQFIEFLWSKNKRYGHRSLTRWGAFGIVVRMDSKIQRLINMLQSPELTADFEEAEMNESIEDTWIDILGYSALGLMVLKGAFQ